MNNFYNKMIYRYENKFNIDNKNFTNMFMNDLPILINNNIGYLQINVSSKQGKVTVNNASITVYVRGDEGPIQIYSEVLDNSSTTISLPVSHPLGTQIRGPEYYFTTYDVTVIADCYSPYRCNNLRFFEGITTNLDVFLTPVVPGVYPIPEHIVDIPPHPRDHLKIMRFKYLCSFK